jgi:hypothetical protein
MLDRRGFLGLGAAAAVGAAAIRPARATAAAPGIQRSVTLGRTGLEISDISFGSSSSSDPDLVRHALDRGITHFDTAESYRFGTAEEAIGEGLQGVRDKVTIASKTKARAGDGEAEMMEALEGSLRRLRTDYLDIYFNHAVNNVERMANEAWWSFTERAKEQGKIRFRGMSGHGSRLVPCLEYAIDNDLVDVVLTAYNFGQDPDFYDKLRHLMHFVDMQPGLPRTLAKAKTKGVGVIAMKTLMGARLNDMRPFEREGGTFAQAAFRWVLSSPVVDGMIVSMTSREKIDEYVAASGTAETRSDADLRLLARYAERQAGFYCRHGCDACVDSCPHGVEIAEVLRTRMYDADYGDARLAREDYARLDAPASPCLGCSGAPCAGACPYGLPIPALTRDTATRIG